MSARHELILGGARSGKSRTAEQRAADWLAADGAHIATLLATALRTGDPEMAERITRHRADRAGRLPALQTLEAPAMLGRQLRALADADHLIVVDCLTLWITQCLLPPPGFVPPLPWPQEQDELIAALRDSASPVVLVSNEIGLGVLPLARETRVVVDALGRLHQAVAATCARVTLMVAGCECRVKEQP